MALRKNIRDRQYWKDRHETVGDLKASGLQSVGLRANRYIYQILVDEYAKLLDRVDMGQVKSILDCGYGDGYFLKFFADKYPDRSLMGVDISSMARKKIDFLPKTNLVVGDLTNFKLSNKSDLVHCFDVLYHIIDEKDYALALANLADHSSRYVALHERFLERAALVSSPHVRLRRREVTNQILNSKGFFYHTETPTHFFAMRTLTFKLNKIAPRMLYKIDSYIINNLPNNLRERLASHTIRIYKKAEK